MRRRSLAIDTDDEGLVMTPDALPTYVDDVSAPVANRLAAYEGYMSVYTAWCKRRERWQELHGWPGGILARTADEARFVPDMPFDPDTI